VCAVDSVSDVMWHVVTDSLAHWTAVSYKSDYSKMSVHDSVVSLTHRENEVM